MIIHYTLPPNPTKTFETDAGRIIIGRRRKKGRQVDLDLSPDSYVSKQHARLTCEDGEYWIEDLGSGNGTWVNGQKVGLKTRLRAGTKVRIGWTNLEVEIEGAPQISATPQAAGIEGTIEPERPPAPEMEGTVSSRPRVEAEVKDIPLSEQQMENEPEGSITSERDLISEFIERELQEEDAEAEPESRADTLPRKAFRQLRALNDFSQELAMDTTLEALGQILIKQLQQAIPTAQRGAVLLPDERGGLLLKAHWPQGDHSVSMTWVNRAFTEREAFIWTSAETPGEEDTPHSAIYYDVKSAIYVPLLIGGDSLGVIYVDNYYARDAFSPTDLEVLKAIAYQVAMYIRDNVLRKDLQRQERLRSNLLRQFSPKMVEQLIEKTSRLERGGERVDPVTILICDVRNFTALSAEMSPDDVVRMLNEMFDALVPIIAEHDGVVDKFVGDCVLAVFGSPEPDDMQWEKALRASLDIQNAIRMLGEGRKVRRLPVFHVGVGVHTGEAIHGFVGASDRIEFTVIGDTVNRASRFCDGAGPGEILISKDVYEHVYRLVDVEPKTVKTKHPEAEGDLEGYIVRGIKNEGERPNTGGNATR